MNGFAASPLTLEENTALAIELSQYWPLTTIIIDLLDECDPQRRHELLEFLSALLHEFKSLIKVLVSSREDRDIVCYLAGCINLELEAINNREDISQFVDHEVDNLIAKKRLLLGNVPEDLRQKIKATLCSQAHGISVHLLRFLYQR